MTRRRAGGAVVLASYRRDARRCFSYAHIAERMVDGQSSNPHERRMARALEEARRAEGQTSPNPLVGCVLVDPAGEIRAVGHHAGPGLEHAERAALDATDADPAGWDVYVNLEPCCHHGRTPPCTEALIEAGVDRVWVGTRDPHPEVDGGGIAALREAGIDVEVGICEEACRRINRHYFTYVEEGRPWVSVKYAMSLDGKIATRTGDSRWITGASARRRVHELRDRYDAIMVGTGTLTSDDPRLTSRIEGGTDPLRVVLDARLDVPTDANIVERAGEGARTVVVAGPETEGTERRSALADRGVDVWSVSVDEDGHLDLGEVLARLEDDDVVRLFVEGGGTLIGSLFRRQFVDRVYAFVAPKIVGGSEAPTPHDGVGVDSMEGISSLGSPEFEQLGEDLLIRGDVAREDEET